VKQSVDQWSRLALAVAMTAALGLSACGRKGPLDPPPSGLAPPPAYAPAPRPSLGEENYAPAPPPAGARTAAVASPAATAPPPQKSFFLDFLLAK
jgi:predicted small lipoprotein YifL